MGLRILYGVNGEGLGHATRSQVVARALLERHDVRVVTSGAARADRRERLPDVEEGLARRSRGRTAATASRPRRGSCR